MNTKQELNSMYGRKLCENPPTYDALPAQTGFATPPNGAFSDCSRFPCSSCYYYRMGAHECTRFPVDYNA